eukprot:scpid22121/ scgid25693/ Kinesin-like protein KIF17; KIF3-related motor protein
MAEAVKVIVRCRPLNRREKDLNCGVVVQMDEKTGQVGLVKPGAEGKKEPPKNFTFDGAFFVNSLTETIYENIGFPLVEGVMEGYNGTVFAYGQTGCGKSFSMTGIEDPPTQRGIIPRAFKHIFESVASNNEAKFLIHGSYLEIYNEEIRDLLGKDSKSKLDLKEHPDKGVYVKDLTKMGVHSVAEIEHVMELGGKNRSVGATLMNADSSRSHSIFTISLERCDADADSGAGLRAAKLNLVDLAGSERQGKTGATGDRLKEATKINLSLSALGNVISALVDGKAKHIPYRDSKLTRMLQDSLGGNTKTLMVACVSPADNNYDETLSTLRYANRAKNIKNKPKINEDPKDALLREYSDEIARLKAMLTGQGIPTDISAAQSSTGASAGAGANSRELEEAREAAAIAQREAEEIRRQYQQQVQEMQASFKAAQASNEELERNLASLQTDFKSKEADAKRRLSHAESQLTNLAPGQDGGEHNQAVQDAVVFNAEEAAHGEEPTGAQQQKHRKLRQAAPHQQQQQAGLPASTVSNATATMAAQSLSSATSPQQVAALQRLQQLQGQLVGGERAGDSVLKEQLQTRRKHADTMKETLAQNLEDDGDLGVMEAIYDNMQDAIRAKHKQLEKVTARLKASEAEVMDLQEEFERDRYDYLDTIRNQDKALALQQQILDIVVPCLRQNCNYKNLDWVKNVAVWNEEDRSWKLPKLELVKDSLPAATAVGLTSDKREQHPRESPHRGRVTTHGVDQAAGSRTAVGVPMHMTAGGASGVANGRSSPATGIQPVAGRSMYEQLDEDSADSDARLRAKLSNTTESDYFKPKRATQLLAEAAEQRRRGPMPTPNYQQRYDALPNPNQLPPYLSSSGGPQLKPLNWLTGDNAHPQTPPQSQQTRQERKPPPKSGLGRHGALEPLNKDVFRRPPY